MNRRQLLKYMGAAGAVGVLRPSEGWFAALRAQIAPPDWPARIAALPRPAAGEIVVTAVGDMIISSAATGRSSPDAQEMYRVLREADATFGNCEEPIATVGFMYQKAAQMAWPPVLDDLKAAGFTMLSNAKVLAGSGWMGLKDREAYVTRGVKLIPMFTGFMALAALLFLLALTWWREGR